MSDVGIVLVSHSKQLAQGVVELIHEVARDINLTYVGGSEGGIGTSFDQVEAIVATNPSPTLLAFFDLGSARMNLEIVAEVSDKNLLVQPVPFVEGAYTAASLLQAGADLEAILAQLSELTICK